MVVATNAVVAGGPLITTVLKINMTSIKQVDDNEQAVTPTGHVPPGRVDLSQCKCCISWYQMV